MASLQSRDGCEALSRQPSQANMDIMIIVMMQLLLGSVNLLESASHPSLLCRDAIGMISILTKGRDIPRDGCGGHPGGEQCFGDLYGEHR